MLLRCQTSPKTKQQATRNKASLKRKDFIGVKVFPPPLPNRNKLSRDRRSEEVACQHENNHIGPIIHGKSDLQFLDCRVCAKPADIRVLASCQLVVPMPES